MTGPARPSADPQASPPADAAGGIAVVTASYHGDIERFALLAETMDRHMTGHTRHLVLVASRDVAAFRRFAGPRREIVDEADLLPAWLRRHADPLSRFRRDIWISHRLLPFTWPLRGWHVQQLRRLAISRHIGEAAILHTDSDVAFVAPYDARANWSSGRLRLYRVEDALAGPSMAPQRAWSALAARQLGLAGGAGRHDYINTLVPWSVPAARRLLDRIERVGGDDFVTVLGRARTLSECTLYGRFVEDCEGMAGHFPSPDAHCRVYWEGPPLDEAGLSAFISGRQGHQAAIGLQSFVGTPIGAIRRVIAA